MELLVIVSASPWCRGMTTGPGTNHLYHSLCGLVVKALATGTTHGKYPSSEIGGATNIIFLERIWPANFSSCCCGRYHLQHMRVYKSFISISERTTAVPPPPVAHSNLCHIIFHSSPPPHPNQKVTHIFGSDVSYRVVIVMFNLLLLLLIAPPP